MFIKLTVKPLAVLWLFLRSAKNCVIILTAAETTDIKLICYQVLRSFASDVFCREIRITMHFASLIAMQLIEKHHSSKLNNHIKFLILYLSMIESILRKLLPDIFGVHVFVSFLLKIHRVLVLLVMAQNKVINKRLTRFVVFLIRSSFKATGK